MLVGDLIDFVLVLVFKLFLLQVYLGEQYVNNPTLSDITFLVEGSKFSCICCYYLIE
jgi:hypothetical protein